MSPDAVLSRSARFGTVVRGYQLPVHLYMDSLESLVDADLEEELAAETRSAFEMSWRKTAKDLQTLAPDSDISDPSTSIKSASPAVLSSPSPAGHAVRNHAGPHPADSHLADDPLCPPPVSNCPETPENSQIIS